MKFTRRRPCSVLELAVRILQIHNFYKVPGGECGVVEAERRLLEEHGNTVLQFAVDSREIDSMPLLKQGLAFVQIPWNVGVARRLVSFVHKHRPDVVHVHNVFPLLSPSVYHALSRSGVSVVQTVHNYRFLCPNGLFYVKGKVCEACQEQSYWAAVKNCCVHESMITSALYASAVAWGWRSGTFSSCIDRYIALNSFSFGKLVAAGVPKDKVRVCGNFVSNFSEAPPAKQPYALYLGRLSAEKGLKTLLAAAGSVPDCLSSSQELDRWKLICVEPSACLGWSTLSSLGMLQERQSDVSLPKPYAPPHPRNAMKTSLSRWWSHWP
ncbi:MAG: glycosyltransferase [Nitrospira sp.]|nr:glycosyltransferase [Nitrospira sp.]